jgi:hypothetical protein
VPAARDSSFFWLAVIFGVVPALVGVGSAGLSLRACLKQKRVLQFAAVAVVLSLVIPAVAMLTEIFLDDNYPTYAPFVFIGLAAVISVIQGISSRRTLRGPGRFGS